VLNHYKQTKMVKINKKKAFNVVRKIAKSKQVRNAMPQPLRQFVDSAAHEATLIGLTDPFSAEAAVTRYPDQGSGKSMVQQSRLTTQLSTNAAGNAFICFNPRANFPEYVFTSAAGNVVTWPAAWTGDLSTNMLNTHGYTYRPTSMGIRISNLLSATASAGTIAIAKSGPPSGTTTFDPSRFTSWDQHSLIHGGEWHVTSHPRSANAYDFRPVTDTAGNTTAPDNNWESVYVAVQGTGVVSLPVVQVEVFINYEFTFQEDSGFAGLAGPQPVLDIHMQTAINEVQSSHPPSHKGGTHVIRGFIKKQGKKALLKHVLPFVAKKGAQILL
jgi:hypothetical protein